MVSFTEAIKICLTKKYFKMSGRATRAEYWWFQLFIWLVFGCIGVISSFGDKDFQDVCFVIYFIVFLLTLIPNLCVCVRRLHDCGHSGLMFLWCLLGVGLGLLIINIVNIQGSDPDNEYGPHPESLTLRTPQESKLTEEPEIVQEVETKQQEVTDVEL